MNFSTKFTLLVSLLIYTPCIYSQPTPVNFYNKQKVDKIGSVYVKASGQILGDKIATIWINEIINSTAKQFVAIEPRVYSESTPSKGDIKGSCTGNLPQIKCTVDLSKDTTKKFESENLEIRLRMNDGTSFQLFVALYNDYKFTYKNDQCKTDYYGSKCCVCAEGFYEKIQCKDYVPTQCYNLDVTIKPKDLVGYSKPAVKIEFKETFDKDNIESKSLYVYDDSTFQFYALSYEKVESDVDARPVDPNQFRLKFRIGEIVEEISPSKENYMIANFPIKEIVEFKNAFCKKDESSSKIIICVCCEYSETDPFCKAKHSDNEYHFYGNGEIVQAGLFWLQGAKIWTNKKQFHIQFFDAKRPFFKVNKEFYTLKYMSSQGGRQLDIKCEGGYIDFPCYLELNEQTGKDGNIGLEVCPYTKTACTWLFKIPIKDYLIDFEPTDNTQCQMTAGATSSMKQCICPTDIDASQVQKPNNGIRCVPTPNKCTTSGVKIFEFESNRQNMYTIVARGGKFLASDRTSRFPVKIWVSRMLNSGSTDGKITKSTSISSNVNEFLNSYCSDKKIDNDKYSFECYCCDDTLAGCYTTDEYEFYFAQNVNEYGFLKGSGVAWVDGQNLNARVDYLYPNNGPTNTMELNPRVYMCTMSVGQTCYTPLRNDISITFRLNRASTKVVTFYLEDNNRKIKVEDESGCDFHGDDTTKIYYCICKSGQRTDENCPLESTLMQQCTLGSSQSNNESPKLVFDSNGFKRPEEYGKSVTQYFSSLKDSSKTYHLIYEPLQQMGTQHPADDPVFLMNVSIAQSQYTNLQQDKALSLIETNFETDNKLWTFNQAYCQLNSDKVECTCCGGSQSNNNAICLRAETSSETNSKFSIIIPNYGLLMIQFKLTLNSLGRFTLERTGPIIKEFSQSFRLKFLKNGDTNDVQYCKWPECLFTFKSSLNSGDKIQIEIELLKNDESILTNSNQIDIFTVDDGKIKLNGKENECYLYQNHDKYAHICSCPKDHDFDGNCEEMDPIQCQAIKEITKYEVKNKTRIFPSFYLKMGDPGENNPTFVFDEKNKQYYTFSYSVNKGSESTKPVYKISIGPTKSTQTLTNIPIQINFNFSLSLIQFNDVSCSFANNEWFCECCSGKDCASNDPNINLKPSTSKPTTKNPSNNLLTTKKPSKTVEDRCKNRPKNKETSELCDIDKTKIDSSTIDTVTKEIKKAINPQKASADDIAIAGDIISKMADVKDATVEQRKSTIELFDHILESKEESFKENGRETSDNYLNSMDKILAESKEDISYLNGSNLGAEKKQLNCEDSQSWTGILDDSQKFDVKNGGINPGDGIASIELNKESFCKDSDGNSKQSIYFVIYRNGKLFQADDNGQGKEGDEAPDDIKSSSNSKQTNRCKKGYDPTNGFILSSVVSNKNASINARLRFKKEDFKLPPHSNLAVTWWDKTEWSENKQCTFKLEEDEYVAHCDHLTNFALLVEKSSTDPLLCDTVLDKIGFWLCILSLVALFILALIYLTRLIPVVKDSALIAIVNNQRRSGADTLIIVYVLIMLMFYFMFTIFVDQSMTNSKVFCKITAAFLYFLFLSAMFLNLFQAWDMIKMCSWNSQMENILQILTRIYIVLPISFGLPFLIVIIVFFADSTFFFRDDQFCWIKPQSIIFAVLIPVTLMLLNSFVAFGIFCVRMFPDFFKRFGIKGSSVQLAKGEKQSRRMNLELFIVLLFAQFILGFPWILQYPAMFSSGSTTWHYLFAIFNGTNGIILFLIYFYGRAMAFYRLRTRNNSTGNTESTNATSET